MNVLSFAVSHKMQRTAFISIYKFTLCSNPDFNFGFNIPAHVRT